MKHPRGLTLTFNTVLGVAYSVERHSLCSVK